MYQFEHPIELHGSFGNNSDHSDRVNRDADTKETEVNVVTKVAGDVDRDATTKECEGVNREAATREPNECGGIVSRDATTVESDAPVDRESTTKGVLMVLSFLLCPVKCQLLELPPPLPPTHTITLQPLLKTFEKIHLL